MSKFPEKSDRNPDHAWIEPTTRCNTRCYYCLHYYGDFGQDMSPDTYRKIRDALFDSLDRAELVGYGEPLISGIFWEMFDECARRGITVATTTNGLMLLKDENLKRMVTEDVIICFSIDGVRKETAEFARTVPFETQLKILDKIRQAANDAGDKKRFQLRLNVVAMKKNISELPELVLMARNYGARTLMVFLLFEEDERKLMWGQSVMDSPHLVAEPLMKAVQMAVENKIELIIPWAFRDLALQDARDKGSRILYLKRLLKLSLFKIRERGIFSFASKARKMISTYGRPNMQKCDFPWNSTYFSAEGNVFPCCGTGRYPLGNIREQSWEKIWNGPRYRNLRRTIHSWNPTDSCRHCGLPGGINGGDEHRFCRFFDQFEETPVALDDPMLEMGKGFHELEFVNDRPHHYWMGKEGRMKISKPEKAKYLWLKILPLVLGKQPNPGLCIINDRWEHPFDDSCDELRFPVKKVKGPYINLTFTMEKVYHPENDQRELTFPITGISWLS